ncbi:MAG: hypothetical protein J2P31_01050, partial [Blastocatellia bacterium]|nr:hypothetical protein [Blastocatellia bacterium]
LAAGILIDQRRYLFVVPWVVEKYLIKIVRQQITGLQPRPFVIPEQETLEHVNNLRYIIF